MGDILGVMFITCLINYLISSIPFGLILTKLFLKKDIREIGSGNIGATNVLRTGSKTLALFTLILDVFKPVVFPLILFLYVMEAEWGAFMFMALLVSMSPFIVLSSVLGHMFPVYLKFKGGKGVATAFGGLFLITKWMDLFFISIPVLPIVAFIVWLFIAVLFKKSSLAALTSGVVVLFLIPFYSWGAFDQSNNLISVIYISVYTVIYILILYKHRDNIKRLLNKTEPNISFKKPIRKRK